jgi:hypothetical protein
MAWACSSIGCGNSGPTTGAPTADSGAGIIQGAGTVDAGDASKAPGSAGDNGAAGNVDDAEGVLPPDSAATDGPALTPPDSGTIASDAGSACPGLFCEDFETGQLDTAKWDPQTKGGTVEVQKTTVAHGSYALHFHGSANPGMLDYAYIIAHKGPQGLLTHHFGRAYLYITPKPRSVDMGLIYAGTAGFPRPTYLSIANNGVGWGGPTSGHGGWQFGLIKLAGTPGYERQFYPQGEIPAATWACLQWEFNDQPDSITVSLDGTMLGTLNDQHVSYPAGYTPGTPLSGPGGTSSGIIGGFVDFGFGYYDWHSVPVRPAIDIYYDDIVLDAKAVDCLH